MSEKMKEETQNQDDDILIVGEVGQARAELRIPPNASPTELIIAQLKATALLQAQLADLSSKFDLLLADRPPIQEHDLAWIRPE